MKYITKIMALLFIGWLVVSCGDKGYDLSEVPTFNIKSADVQYPASGGSGIVEFQTQVSGTPTIAVDKNWCNATLSGNRITIIMDGHAEMESREVSLTISLGDYSRTIGLYQGGIYYYVTDNDYGELGYKEGDALYVPLTRDGDINIKVVGSPDWIDASVVGDNLVIIATEDNGFAKREGNVLLQIGSQDAKRVAFVQTERPLDYGSYLGTWLMTSYDAYSVAQENIVNFSVNVEGESYLVEGLNYPMIVDFVDGVISFYASQVVGSIVYSGVTYDVIIRVVNDASSSNSSSSYGIYSTYEITDEGQLMLTLNSTNSSYTGFGFYYTRPSGNIYMAKFRTEIKMYKQ